MAGHSPNGFALERHLANLADDGLTVVEDFLDRDTIAEVRTALAPYLNGRFGRTDFEGERTERLYTLVARGKIFERIVEDARMLALAGRVLQGEFLLSVTQAINIHPGENAQGFHRDGGYYALPLDYRPVCIGMIAAVDDFTKENGATEMFPGSHKWTPAQITRFNATRNDTALAEEYVGGLKAIEMPAGACVIFVGTLVHRAGANRSTKPRLALTNQYCEAWLRTQETFHLGIPPARVRNMSRRLQQLLGYDTVGSALGNLSGVNPSRALQEGFVVPVVAEDPEARA